MPIPSGTFAPVSVVIPCYRCDLTIDRAVQSVANQTLLPKEVILVDDGNGEGTKALLHRIARAYSEGWVQVVTMAGNAGVASARNAGWAVATQELIAFLDADDAWHPRKIELQFQYMQEHPEVSLSGHSHLLSSSSDISHEVAAGYAVSQIKRWDLLLSNQFITPSVMLRRVGVSRFLNGRRHMEDHLLWLEILSRGGRIDKLMVPLALIYKQPFGVAGLSSQLWSMEKGDLENYFHLYVRHYLTGWELCLLTVFSLLKFVRRLSVYWLVWRWRK